MRDSPRPRPSAWFLLCTCFLGAFALGGCQSSGQETAGRTVAEPAPENYRDFQHADSLAAHLRSSPDPLVSAHRGGPDTGFPENALPTFRHALTHGPALLETDVRMTRDSVLVLMHDATLDRTTTGRDSVRAHTLEELRSLQLVTNSGTPTHFEIPTLPEALAWADGRTALQLDVKDNVPRSRVAASLRQHDALDQALVITYTLEDARWYHQRLPNLILSVSAETSEEANALVRAVDPSRLLGWVGIGAVADGPAEVFSKNEVPVSVGTFGETDQQARSQGLIVYHRLFDQGVDVISTDETALASQAAATYDLQTSN